jgi:tetraacyldisaccharide 4'-kinase
VRDALARTLTRLWWRPRATLGARLLEPLSLLAAAVVRARQRRRSPWRAPVPVIVVGNLVVGGAGKTPTVIALVRALRADGWHPGVVSRGYGRKADDRVRVVGDGGTVDPSLLGDEPSLIHRATGAPIAVAASRVDAARALLERQREVDLIVADDGLQHTALGRDVEVWVFDERGVGNGLGLPAGPLRQPLPEHAPRQALVLYNAPAPSTPLPGTTAERSLAGALALADWERGDAMDAASLSPLAARSAAGRPWPALAGIAVPERFFAMLRATGFKIVPCPLPDHATFEAPPWPDDTADVLCTEKDAVKLVGRADLGTTRVWVVGLDFRLPARFLDDLRRRLPARTPAPAPTPHPP